MQRPRLHARLSRSTHSTHTWFARNSRSVLDTARTDHFLLSRGENASPKLHGKPRLLSAGAARAISIASNRAPTRFDYGERSTITEGEGEIVFHAGRVADYKAIEFETETRDSRYSIVISINKSLRIPFRAVHLIARAMMI